MDTSVAETNTVPPISPTDAVEATADVAAEHKESTEVQQQDTDATIKPETKQEAQEVPAGNTASQDQSVKEEPGQDSKQEKAEVTGPTDAELTDTLLGYLKEDTFTMDVTERQLRSRLESHFGVPLKDRKAIIRDQIMSFIQAKQEGEAAASADAAAGGEDEDAGEEEEEEDEEPEPTKKRKRGGGGLNAGCRLSEPLQAFLGEESMSRPQVVKAMWAYIRENDLQMPNDRRKIRVDEKLATIFNPPLDMFNMNKQLSKHVKTNDGPSPAAASDSEDEDDDEPRPKKTKAAPRKRQADSPDAAPKKRKAPKRKADPDAPKKASAFTRPLKVSPEMSRWLGGASQISRPELTKKFWAYAKENNLLNPNNKQEVICDAALKELTGEDSFKCFGFAKYIKGHLLGYADAEEGVKEEVKEEMKEEIKEEDE